MSWLKRQQPIELYQSSDLPYVITDEGLKLCFDNCYSDLKEDNSMSFRISKKMLYRISSHYYKIRPFPYIVPFQDVIDIPKIVSDGKIIKEAIHQEHNKRTLLVRDSYIDKLSYMKLHKLLDKINKTKSFILVGNNDSNLYSSVKALHDIADVIHHISWYRTMVHVAGSLCKQRGVNWTKMLPGISMDCYGLHEGELSKIDTAMKYIGVGHCDYKWKTIQFSPV